MDKFPKQYEDKNPIIQEEKDPKFSRREVLKIFGATLFTAVAGGGLYKLLEAVEENHDWPKEKCRQWVENIQNNLHRSQNSNDRLPEYYKLFVLSSFPDYKTQYLFEDKKRKLFLDFKINNLYENPEIDKDFMKPYQDRMSKIYLVNGAEKMADVALFESNCPNHDQEVEIVLFNGMAHKVEDQGVIYSQQWCQQIIQNRPNLYSDLDNYIKNTKYGDLYCMAESVRDFFTKYLPNNKQ